VDKRDTEITWIGAWMTMRLPFLENGVTVFPFDTEGTLVYNSGAV
jgi:hypothetical protein